ncbi:MAG: ABC transporter ATP-binding protein [Planctomycetes bacterium]|nr:ABC transporter ATP-binding protein [Planctomycetota bacterium]
MSTSSAPTAKSYGTLGSLRRLALRLRPRRALVVAAYALVLAGIGIALALPRLAGLALDAIQAGARTAGAGVGGGAGPDFGLAALPWALLAAYLGLVVVENGIRSLSGILRTRIEAGTLAELRIDLVAAVQKLGFRYHDRSSAGEVIAKATRDVERVAPFYSDFLFSVAELVLHLGGAAAMICLYDAKLGMIAGVLALAFVYLTFRYASRLRALWEVAGDQYDTVTSVVQESVAGVRVVKAFGAGGREIERFDARVGVYRDLCVKAELFWTNRAPAAFLCVWVSLPLALAWGGARVIRGTLSLGSLAAVVFYLIEMTHRLRIVSRVVQGVENALASAGRIFELLDADERLPAAAEPCAPAETAGALALRDVCFEYGEDLPALRGVSLAVAPGETVAVVGPTGSGKSTVMALVPRFYDVLAGAVELDGVDVRRYRPEDLRRRIGLVFQETFLFSATIAENIAFGRPGATAAEIERAARRAQVDEFVRDLPDGYATVVGERGINLSGGQKQRIAIARAILADPRVLILDDATSSVDARTERALQVALAAVARGRTTLIIAQRLTSVLIADRVVVMEGGRKVDEGTHRDLLARCPLYAELFAGQWIEETPEAEALRSAGR